MSRGGYGVQGSSSEHGGRVDLTAKGVEDLKATYARQPHVQVHEVELARRRYGKCAGRSSHNGDREPCRVQALLDERRDPRLVPSDQNPAHVLLLVVLRRLRLGDERNPDRDLRLIA